MSESRTIKFPIEKRIVTVGEIIDALKVFPSNCELLIAINDDKMIRMPLGVSDNRDWGSDNDCAFIEIKI